VLCEVEICVILGHCAASTGRFKHRHSLNPNVRPSQLVGSAETVNALYQRHNPNANLGPSRLAGFVKTAGTDCTSEIAATVPLSVSTGRSRGGRLIGEAAITHCPTAPGYSVTSHLINCG
jgi:hypothetical protein